MANCADLNAYRLAIALDKQLGILSDSLTKVKTLFSQQLALFRLIFQKLGSTEKVLDFHGTDVKYNMYIKLPLI